MLGVLALYEVVRNTASTSRAKKWVLYVGGLYVSFFLYWVMSLLLFQLLALAMEQIAPSGPWDTVGFSLALVCAFLVVLYGIVHAHTVVPVRYAVAVGEGRQPYRVVLLSDVHLGIYNGANHLAKVVEAVNAAQPDLVVIAGDLFDGSQAGAYFDQKAAAAQFRRIQAPDGVVLAVGNHDPATTDFNLRVFLRESKIAMLHDCGLTLGRLVILGRNDAISVREPDCRRPLQMVASGYQHDRSIVFFKHCEKYIVSFADNVCSHILSDWHNVGMDYDDIIDRICVGNISLTTSNEYFHDFLYAVAREYYIRPISFEEASYGLMPADYITKSLASDISFSKDEIKEIIQSNLVAFETVYGDDYVEPKYTGMEELNQHHNISAEIDRISFELELNSDIDDAQLEQFDFEEEGFEEDNDDDFFDGYDENVDPAIFDDPVLMVKWLEKKQKERDSETLKNQEQEHLEAACREQERLDAARQEQELLDAARQEQERLDAARREQERLDAARRERDLEAARQEQERIKTERAHLFSQLENTHLTKLKELESRYLAEKKRLHHELLQIEKGIQEKNNQLSKLSFLRFLERRSLTADLEKLGQRKQKLLMLIQDIESMYNEQCNKERTEFSMILAEKGL